MLNRLKNLIGEVEIVRDREGVSTLERVFFPIPHVCNYLTSKSKTEFQWKVERDTPNDKIEGYVKSKIRILIIIIIRALSFVISLEHCFLVWFFLSSFYLSTTFS